MTTTEAVKHIDKTLEDLLPRVQKVSLEMSNIDTFATIHHLKVNWKTGEITNLESTG